MSHGFVTSATFSGGEITFNVGVYDFKEGEYVEISGDATQRGGAFANIYQIARVPAAGNGAKGEASIPVTVKPQSVKPFDEYQGITVFIRVAKVWVTVLGAATAPGEDPPSADGGITWNDVREVSQMNGDTGSSEGYQAAADGQQSPRR